MANVELRNVRKTYGSVEVIKGIDVSIHDGEFVALVGPSGCGKSTLLRMIAGLEDFSSGEVVIGDRVVNDIQPKERDIAMVFQSYALYPNLSVRANLGFALKLRKAPKAEREAKVARAASILGLTELLDRYPRQLSGGQRQRVAMGRAIVRDPKVFLFDEPLSNLDAKLRVQMRAEIRSLHRKLATTTIYVTHDQVEAMTMADRIVVIRAGKVEQVGRPLDLYDNPANLFVATFIGSPAMNLLEGSMTESGTFCLADSAHELTVPPLAEPPVAGTRVLLGIRPEHLEIAETGLPVTLTAIEPTGHETFLGAEVDGQKIGILAGERVSVSIDEQVAVRLRPDRTMVFGVENGLRFAPIGGQAGTGL